jgi:hypothetical protein
MDPERRLYLDFTKAQAGVPYIWAKKGLELNLNASVKGITNPDKRKYPVQRMDGSDCSGLVTCGIWVASEGEIDWRADKNCNALWTLLDDVAPPNIQAGDLAFYGFGKNMLTHVMSLDDDMCRVYGACGGGHTCTTPEEAHRLDAKVQFRKNPQYRNDFRGFKRLPL